MKYQGPVPIENRRVLEISCDSMASDLRIFDADGTTFKLDLPIPALPAFALAIQDRLMIFITRQDAASPVVATSQPGASQANRKTSLNTAPSTLSS